MGQTLVRSFDRFENARLARDALLASGFAEESVHLESTQDEAGPVAGNAVIDAKDMGTGPGSKPGPFIMSREKRTDAYNNSTPEWRGNFLLTVDADDERQRSLASDIIERYASGAGGAGVQPGHP
ncbi:MAG: hypothetical protein ACM3WS_04890 [Bacillota bacterium]